MVSHALQRCKALLSHLQVEPPEVRHAGCEGVGPVWLALHAAVIKRHAQGDLLQAAWQVPQCLLAQADGVGDSERFQGASRTHRQQGAQSCGITASRQALNASNSTVKHAVIVQLHACEVHLASLGTVPPSTSPVHAASGSARLTCC